MPLLKGLARSRVGWSPVAGKPSLSAMGCVLHRRKAHCCIFSLASTPGLLYWNLLSAFNAARASWHQLKHFTEGWAGIMP